MLDQVPAVGTVLSCLAAQLAAEDGRDAGDCERAAWPAARQQLLLAGVIAWQWIEETAVCNVVEHILDDILVGHVVGDNSLPCDRTPDLVFARASKA